jgi:ATP-binding cassette subfamily F protein uup
MQVEIAEAENALADADLYTRDPSRFATLTEKIARNRAEIEAAEQRWLEVAELAEALTL